MTFSAYLIPIFSPVFLAFMAPSSVHFQILFTSAVFWVAVNFYVQYYQSVGFGRIYFAFFLFISMVILPADDKINFTIFRRKEFAKNENIYKYLVQKHHFNNSL
jgi:hypothetical protein